MMLGKKSRKAALMLLAAALILTAAVGATAAFLSDGTDPLVNIFTPARVSCEIEEDFGWSGETDPAVKSNVTVKNTGNVDAYIRARVVVTWKNASGVVHGSVPPATGYYTISYNQEGWFKANDGYWYCKAPVAPEELTPILIGSVIVDAKKSPAPTGYDLSVEILADAIQSKPARAVTDNWKVTVNADGTLGK